MELKGAHLKGGTIRVWDDGNGTSLDEIRNGWLIVGDSLKNRGAKTPAGRLLVGSKGLGRLSALRLGDSVQLSTRPIDQPGAEYRVTIDWRAFDQAKVVEDVEILITKQKAPMGALHGTDILISDLPTAWRKADVQRLARAILLLRDPFSEDKSFEATLKADEFIEMERLAHAGYFSECDFHLTAKMDADGKASAEMRSAGGELLFEAGHNKISDAKGHPIYATPPASFKLWEFNLSAKAFAPKKATLKAVRSWLDQFGGVRLYHRGVRILPYGEPQNDWLDMNLRRAASPELRPRRSPGGSQGFAVRFQTSA